MNEIWRNIPEWEGLYQASSDGRVKSLDHVITFFSKWGTEGTRLCKGKIKNQTTDRDGYKHVMLSVNNHHKNCQVHSLVAEAFPEICGEKLPGYEVSHLDEDPTNNRPENLRWVSHKDNINWGTHKERMLKNRKGSNACKPVCQYKDDEVVGEYPSATEAARQIGCSHSAIVKACNEGYKCKNYKWSYV